MAFKSLKSTGHFLGNSPRKSRNPATFQADVRKEWGEMSKYMSLFK